MCPSFRIHPTRGEETPKKILLLSIVTSAKTVNHDVLFKFILVALARMLRQARFSLCTLSQNPQSHLRPKDRALPIHLQRTPCHTVSRSQPFAPLHQRNFSVSPPFPLVAVTLNRPLHCSLAFSSLSSTSLTHFLTHCGHRPPMSL
jgi:hypothetical protein